VTAVDDDLSLDTVYTAENVVLGILDRGGAVDFHGSTLDLSRIKVRRWKPDQLLIMRGIVDGLYQKHRTTGPQRSPALRSSRKAVKAFYQGGAHEIVLPLQPWAWNDLVLMHELAHSLTTGTGRGNRAAHNLAWRKMYAALVSEVIGPEAGLILMNQLNL
jgi:putative metallohydrolase (TIGR04338 family)